MAKKNIVVIQLFVLITFLAACSRDNHDHPELTTGKQLYDHHCAECHKENGKGQFLQGIPANILTSKDTRKIINYLKIREDHLSQMPVFRTMPLFEAQQVTRYLNSLKENH